MAKKKEGQNPDQGPFSENLENNLNEAEDLGTLHEETDKKAPSVTEASVKITQELMSKLNALMKTVEAQNKKISELELRNNQSVNKSDEIIAAEDYLDEPVVFFAYSYYFGIHDDFRNNRISKHPLEKSISFFRAYRWSTKQNGKTVVISISQYTSRSKAEVEWLMNHSLYGVKFYRSMNEAASVDAQLAEKMSSAANVVSAMNDYAVIERCKTENLPVTQNISQMRKELITRIAKKMMLQENELSKMRNDKAIKMANRQDFKTVKIDGSQPAMAEE